MLRSEFLAICSFETPASQDRCWGYIDGVIDAAMPKGWAHVGCPPKTVRARPKAFYEAILQDVRALYWGGSDRTAAVAIQAASFRTTYQSPGCEAPDR